MKTHNSFHTVSRVASMVLAAFVSLMPLTAGADEIVLSNTGGTGTVIFIAVGMTLVVAMGVLLVVKKRMTKVVYTR